MPGFERLCELEGRFRIEGSGFRGLAGRLRIEGSGFRELEGRLPIEGSGFPASAGLPPPEPFPPVHVNTIREAAKSSFLMARPQRI